MRKLNRAAYLCSTRSLPCELCEGKEFQIVGRYDRRRNPLTTVMCATCGLVSHETLPSDEELAAYYARQYRIDYHGEFLPSARRVLRAWRNAGEVYQRVRPFLRPGDRILEVGAGIGCTVKRFEMAGFSAEGIEPHEGFQAFAKRHIRADVARLALAEIAVEPTYDVILLVHVIEHFNHPARELRRLAQLLRPGGRLYIECPNLGAPHAAPGKCFHFAHVYNFTNITLEMLSNACGMERIAQALPTEVRNAAHVVAASPGACLVLNRQSPDHTVSALNRYGTVGYHLRPNYVVDRLRIAGQHLEERICSQRRVNRLLRLCGQPSTKGDFTFNRPWWRLSESGVS